MTLIYCDNLTKTYKVSSREKGIKGITKNLFSTNFIEKTAVNNIKLSIDEGEFVGFIGPNGAGKSTMIKMLIGILYPTSGVVKIDNIIPYKRRKELAKKMGVVFGQRSQLWWNLPLIESFDILKHIYCIPDEIYNKNLKLFNEILGINKYLQIPVRQLSLGQRMQCEIVAALIHNPQIIYLDEPTVGIDVQAKQKIRLFLKELNKTLKTTILLVSHDMQDIEQLANRVVVMNTGQIVYDGDVHTMKSLYQVHKHLTIDLVDKDTDLSFLDMKVIEDNLKLKHILVNKGQSAIDILKEVSLHCKIKDFTLEDPNIDQIVMKIYNDTK